VQLWNQALEQGLPINSEADPYNGSVTISDDGMMVASALGNNVHLWDPISGQPSGILENRELSWVTAIAFSKDRRILASALEELPPRGTIEGLYTIGLWDLASGACAWTIKLREDVLGNIRAITFSHDDQMIASCSRGFFGSGNAIRLWDVASGKFIRLLGFADSPDFDE
jgi:WD40 repeat protein